ncbi:FAD-dependent oxidoreductase [Candidatus Nomurabacteria bacterium]|nr:FAD-dependent oxidoreductase [Candidatus Nomurabacteria bacterium]
MVEIRIHGRGGQGGVTCAKILASVYARLGKSVQTFGEYGAERSGAPVRAYTRISDQLITNRNKVYNPDHILVLDSTLLNDDIVNGLIHGGILLLNTSKSLNDFKGRFENYRLAVVDATSIARKHKIGTRSVIIVNTTIAGAFIKAIGLSLDNLEAAYNYLSLTNNVIAAKEAYEQVQIRNTIKEKPSLITKTPPTPWQPVLPITAHTEGAPTGLKTGSWKTQSPRYIKNLAPCNAKCPAGNDIVGFIQELRKNGGKNTSQKASQKALMLLSKSTPFAGVCGRVCPAPCMQGCNRRTYDGSVNIRSLERWIADNTSIVSKEISICANPVHIAIIGGGPAGLSSAYTLARLGHQVTLFEKEKSLGGVLRTGIPDYRLPRDILDKEISAILQLGVKVNYETTIKNTELISLSKQYAAIIITTGLAKNAELNIPGRTLTGIQQGLDFLYSVNMQKNTQLDGHVVVLGGGNTAIDCARSAKRCGADHVTIIYRRTQAEMPAIPEEIDEAQDKNVDFLFQRQPVAFHGSLHGSNIVTSVELAKVIMGALDNRGRHQPVITENTELFNCDHVLLAIGQSAEPSFLPKGYELKDGRIFLSEKPTNIFLAGDLLTNEGTVAHAIGSGRKMAGNALRALGLNLEVFERHSRDHAVTASAIRMSYFSKMTSTLEATSEAQRCFSCGHCTQCDTCLVYCPDGIIYRKNQDYEIDLTYCKGCGLCAAMCPRKAMEMVDL